METFVVDLGTVLGTSVPVTPHGGRSTLIETPDRVSLVDVHSPDK